MSGHDALQENERGKGTARAMSISKEEEVKEARTGPWGKDVVKSEAARKNFIFSKKYGTSGWM